MEEGDHEDLAGQFKSDVFFPTVDFLGKLVEASSSAR